MIIPQLVANSLISGSIYALVATGLSVTYGLLRVLNFAHGHLMMLGAYFFFWLYTLVEWPLWASLIVALVLISTVGFLVLKVFVDPLQKYNYLLVLVSTLALAIILESVVSMVWGVSVKSIIPPFDNSSLEIAGAYITPVQIIIVVSAIVLISVLAFVIHSTSVGRTMRSLSEHDYAARTLGMNKKRWSKIIFLAGIALAAYAGILIAMETNIQPTMGHMYTIKAFAAMILGGLGNVWGTVFGSYILGAVENFGIGLSFDGWSIPAGYKDGFAFIIILIVLLVRPQGLFGIRSRKE